MMDPHSPKDASFGNTCVNSDTCKSTGCTEPRVNENHCARHTRKLHPLYLRYKDFERQLREAETELSDIPSLLRLYTLCARAYKLRQRYRDAMKSELRDQGHDVAIYRLLLRMRKLDQRLRELTEIQPREVAPTVSHEIEREDELPDNFTPEQALQFGADCRQAKSAALAAPALPMAKVATGTPLGICTML